MTPPARGAAIGGRPRRPPRAGGRLRAIALALAMHLLLVGLLVFGLKWQSRQPEPVQAELWIPPPPPKAEPVPVPRPVVPPPPPPPPRAEPESPQKAEPDIKAEQARREAERKEQERRAEEKRAEVKRAEEKRAAERKLAEAKAADERRQKDEQARKDAEKREAEKKEADRRAAEKAADDKRRAELARKDAEAAEARRAEDIRRLQSQAGTGGIASDQAVKGSAGGRVDAGYGARVGAAIRSNTTYQVTADVEGNPKAVFLVQLRPDCSVAAVRLRKSSGVPAWDQAAERGIQRTDPFPRPADGACQGELEIVRGPRDER